MRTFLLAAALTLPLQLEAAQVPEWVVAGLGSDSCGSYTLALDADQPTSAIDMGAKRYFTMANAYTQWITGFVTAANMSGPETLSSQIRV